MKSFFMMQKKVCYIFSIINIVLGLFLILSPMKSINIICLVLGGAIFLAGLVSVCVWISRRKIMKEYTIWFLVPGIILLIIGSWIASNPSSIVTLIQFIFAVILIFHGIVDIQNSVVLMRNKWSRWWIDMAISIITLMFGVVILFNPFTTFEILIVIIGISLVFGGASNIFIIMRVIKAFNESLVADIDFYR